MPSTADGSSNGPNPSARDLRDSWAFRAAALVAVLLAAFLVARGCASAGRNLSSDEAIEIARRSTTFQPDKVQVRFVQRGIPPRPVWAVSLYDVDAQGRPIRVRLVIVDAGTGDVLES